MFGTLYIWGSKKLSVSQPCNNQRHAQPEGKCFKCDH